MKYFGVILVFFSIFQFLSPIHVIVAWEVWNHLRTICDSRSLAVWLTLVMLMSCVNESASGGINKTAECVTPAIDLPPTDTGAAAVAVVTRVSSIDRRYSGRKTDAGRGNWACTSRRVDPGFISAMLLVSSLRLFIFFWLRVPD